MSGAGDIAAEARSVRIESEIARRGIRLSGSSERCGPCPVCGGVDRFSTNVKKQVWNCRKCATGGDVIALVRHLDGLLFGEAVRLLTGHAPPQKPATGSHGGPGLYKGTGEPAKPSEPPPDNRRPALNIWHQAINPRGTLVEQYLKSRALELPREAAHEAIRFHFDCPFGLSERCPAMICLVRNIITNEPQGVHRTALMPDGTAVKRNGKTFRLSLGSMAGGAIKLDPNEDVTQGICIGEGVETCLSGRLIGYRPVWSVLSTSGVSRFPLLPGIDGLIIFGEQGNGNGLDAAAQGRRFELIPFNKIAFNTTPAYLVKGLIPRVGLCIFWGPPKCGKSFLTFDLLLHVALGREYRGRKIRQGAVVYCVLEGCAAFKNRVEAFRLARLAENSSEVPFYLIASPMSLVADHR